MLRLLASLAVAIAVVLGVASPANATGCNEANVWAAECTVTNTGTSVDLSGTSTSPGREDDSSDRGSRPAPEPTEDTDECTDPRCDEQYAVVTLPEVTVADLASFVPARPTLHSEPAGIGIAGLPSNLVGAAHTQTIPGELFDFEVVVRFTPVSYEFHYGDGTARTATTGGTSWAALRQADFTPTSTSHVYRARGTYQTGVTVHYAAAVDFGGGWITVPGTVQATTSGYAVRIVEAHTALVARTCQEAPSAPGC